MPSPREKNVLSISEKVNQDNKEYLIEDSRTTHAPEPKLGETRMCNDPWTFVQVLGNGEVRPCCFSGVTLGVLSDKTSFEEIFNGKSAQNLRRQLLTGELDEYCKICNMKASIPAEQFQKEIKALYNNKKAQIIVNNTSSEPLLAPTSHSKQPNAFSVLKKLAQINILRQFAKMIFPQYMQNYLYKISR